MSDCWGDLHKRTGLLGDMSEPQHLTDDGGVVKSRGVHARGLSSASAPPLSSVSFNTWFEPVALSLGGGNL